MVQLFYTTYISVDLAHHNIFGVKVGKGGIKYCSMRRSVKTIVLSKMHSYKAILFFL